MKENTEKHENIVIKKRDRCVCMWIDLVNENEIFPTFEWKWQFMSKLSEKKLHANLPKLRTLELNSSQPI